MLKLISKISLNWFALYVIALGILVILLQVTGVMPDAAQAPAALSRIAALRG